MPAKVGCTCRKCRGTLDCTNRDEYHKACKCHIDFRKKAVVRDALRAFLEDRCCTEGAANAILKGGTYRYHEGVEKHLAPVCKDCKIRAVGAGGWKRSRAQCNWSCCPSFNCSCVVGLMNVLQEYPHRLKVKQVEAFEEIVTDIITTAEPEEEGAKPARTVKFAPVETKMEPMEVAYPEHTAVQIEVEPMDEYNYLTEQPVPVPYTQDNAVVVADVDMSGVDECDGDAMEVVGEEEDDGTIPEGTDVCGIFKWPRGLAASNCYSTAAGTVAG